MKRLLQTAITLLILTFGFSLSSYSQSVWFDEPGKESKVGIEVMIPSFDDQLGVESPSSAFYLYSHFPLNDNVALLIDLPVSHFAAGSQSETSIGNPYIGIQSLNKKNLKFDVGVRLPLSADDNPGITTGFLTENYKIGPFFPNTFSALANIHYRYEIDSGFGFRLDGGPEVLAPENADAELFVKYGGQLLYNVDKFTIGTGVIGRLWTTQEGLSFSERSINSFGLTGSYDFGNINIDGYIEIPLNDDSSIFSLGEDVLNAVLGLNLGITI